MLDGLPLVIKGLLVGLIVAAPMGPVNVLCIQRTLINGRIDGFFTGFGAAIGDAVFAVIAAFGLAAAASFIGENMFWFRLAGGLFLIGMSVVIWRSHPHIMRAQSTPATLPRTMGATFFLTVTNPITLAAFAALFVAWDLTAHGSYVAAAEVVGGVLAGSALWWLTLVLLTGLLHGRIEDRHLMLFNRVTAIAILAFGFYAIDSVTLRLMS